MVLFPEGKKELCAAMKEDGVFARQKELR